MDNRQEQKAVTGKRGAASALEAMSHLHRLSSLVASGRFDDALGAAVEIPMHCLGISGTALLLPSPNPERLRLITSRNLPDDLRRDVITFHADDLIGWVIANDAPRVVDELPSSSQYPQYGMRSAACAPVETDGPLPGALLCLSRLPREFAIWEVELISLVANQVSAVLRLQESAPPSRATHLRPPEDAEDSEEIVQRVFAEALTAVNACGGSVMARHGNRLEIVASQNLRDDAPLSCRLSDGTIASWVALNGKPLLLNGRVEDERFASAAERPEIVSAISVPLKGGNSLVGVLNVHSKQPWRTYTHRDINTLSRIAGRVALGIEYARLFEQSKTQARHLRSLYKVARTITSTLDLKTVQEAIAGYLDEHLHAEVCALCTYDRAYDKIEITGGRSSIGESEGQYLELMLPAVKAALRSTRPIEYHDLPASREYADVEAVRRLGLRSGVVVALAVKGEVTGFIAAFSRRPRAFARQEVKVLPGIAELAAMAIENARLYKRQTDIADMTYRSLVPARLEKIPGFEIGYRYEPAYQVGGDYCDIIRLPGGRYGIAIADVAGRDIAAASHIGMFRHSLRALVDEIRSPATLIRKMNRLVCEQTAPEAFISMVYAILDPQRGSLILSSGGHDPALVYRAATSSVEELSTHGLLLGILPDETYRQRRASIQMGDILALYTDGLVDALSSPGVPGIDRLADMLRDSHAQPAQQIADSLYGRAEESGRGADDIALLLLKAQ